ncbi:MAG: esterase-like activity of phytase family protein [Alsobacter sp.]
MSGSSRRRAIALLAAGAGGSALGLFALHRRAGSEPLRGGFGPITVKSTRIEHFLLREPDLRRFGRLDFLGGLELSSASERFGGLSGLAVAADGRRITAVTDKGLWFGGTLTLTAEGAPTGLVDATMAPILGPDGQPLSVMKRSDSEGLAVADGVAFVSFERTPDILRFALQRDGFAARGEILPRPAGTMRLHSNRGLEAIAVLAAGPHAGSVIAIAEAPPRGDDERPTVPGWFVTGPRGATFEVMRHGSFAITDAAVLPGGDLLLLERSFAWLDGVAMRIRRIAARDIRPGARLDGEEILKADMRNQIDNIEGLAVHREPDGSVVLTLVSDDNFSFLQRTILLRFRLVD